MFLGSGTDAAPVGTALFQGDGTYYFSAGVDTAAPRRMWWEGYAVSGSQLTSLLFRDVLVPTEAADAAPYIRGVHTGTSIVATSFTTANAGTPTTTPYFLGYVPSATPTVTTTISMSFPAVGAAPAFPNGSGTLPISGKDPLAVPRYQRGAAQGAPVFVKGESTLFAACGPVRANGDRCTVSSPNDRVVFASMTTPWDNTVVVL